jgi:hypothetical protein
VTDDNGALAAQVADLRGAVERCQAIVTAWDARLETEGIGGTMMLRLEVKQLRNRLDEALAKHQLKPPPAPWWRVDEAEGKAMLAGLRGWVEEFARRHYPGYMARLPSCWANHPEAVWELSTLSAEWERVYGDPDNRDLPGALMWHDKWFPGVLARLAASIKCDQGGCRMLRPRLHPDEPAGPGRASPAAGPFACPETPPEPFSCAFASKHHSIGPHRASVQDLRGL